MTDWKPAHRSTVSSFVVCFKAREALEFARTVFGGELVDEPLLRRDGTLWNAEIVVGGSSILFSEATDAQMHRPAFLYVMVEDVDATYEKALAAGGEALMRPDDQFYGSRDGGVVDPAGNWWWIGTHKEDVPRDVLEKRARELEKKRAGEA